VRSLEGLRADLGAVPEFATRDREESYKNSTRHFPCRYSKRTCSVSEVYCNSLPGGSLLSCILDILELNFDYFDRRILFS
jgi:hypothetical protein